MKITLISSLYGISGGGAGLLAERFAQALTATGYSVTVVTSGTSKKPVTWENSGVKVISFYPRNLYSVQEKDSHPLWQKMIWQTIDIYNPWIGKKLLEIFQYEKPDIIHIHKMRGFSGAVWSVASQWYPGHVVQTCHDYECMSPDGLLRGPLGRMAVRKQWPVRGYQLIRQRLSSGVSVVTAPSYYTLKRIIENGLFPDAYSKVIANTHGWSRGELESISGATTGLSENTIRFLFLGRLEREKGVAELCEAFLRAVAFYPSMKLEIGGWGTQEAELRDKYGKYPTINFLGVVDRKTKESVLSQATIVVVPSLVEEVFGLVTVEAFAFGKPVIACNVGGIPELIREGETGWLVEAGNIEALTQRLLFAAKIQPPLLAKMSRNCKEYSYEFAVEKIIDEYLDIYHQLIK